MSAEEMARHQFAQAGGVRQRGPLTSGEQAAMADFWRGVIDEQIKHAPPPRLTLWARLMRWLRG